MLLVKNINRESGLITRIVKILLSSSPLQTWLVAKNVHCTFSLRTALLVKVEYWFLRIPCKTYYQQSRKNYP